MCKIRESKYSNFEFKETRVKIYNLKIELNKIIYLHHVDWQLRNFESYKGFSLSV